MRISRRSLQSDPRLRHVLIAVGLVAVISFWYLFLNDANGEGGGVVADFDHVTKDVEEDFVTSTRSAINSVKLPFVNVPAPTMNSTKPSLILHVGPIKTGVEEIHKELHKLEAGVLLEDKYVFASPNDKDDSTIDTTALHEACQTQLSLLRQTYSSQTKHKKTLSQTLAQDLPCWKTFLDSLQKLKKNGQSLIVSDDQLSKQLLTNVHDLGPAVLDWIAIRETLQKDFNIVVVANYRRFYEWLPAAKAEAEKVHLIQHSAEVPRLAKWPGRDQGMLLEPLFPHFVQDAVTKLDVAYTTRILELYQPYVASTKVLNMHKELTYNQQQTRSVRTTFVCDILDSAPGACEASKALDQSEDETSHMSAILDIRGDEKWSEFQLLDELVVTAASRNYIRFKHCTRTAATKTTEYYLETHLKMKVQDLPLHCPDQAQLQRFLQESVAYEKKLLPATEISTASHTAGFEEMGTKYCNINIQGVLRQPSWREYFRHLTNTSAKRIQAGGKPGPVRYLRGGEQQQPK